MISKPARIVEAEAGLTLIELIMVMVIVAIISVFIANFLYYEANLFDGLMGQTSGLQNARFALQKMSRDLRHISAPDSIQVAADDSIRCILVDGTSISFRFTNENLMRNSDILVSPVNDVDFGYFDESGNQLSTPVADMSAIHSIAVTFTALMDDKPVTLRARIQPRNF